VTIPSRFPPSRHRDPTRIGVRIPTRVTFRGTSGTHKATSRG
jgi:hypothetical protein